MLVFIVLVLYRRKMMVYNNRYYWLNLDQRRIQHRHALLNFLGGGVNFDCIIRLYFNFSHHTMFTICTLFSSLTTKYGYVWRGHQDKPQIPRILPRRDHAPRFWNSWINHCRWSSINKKKIKRYQVKLKIISSIIPM